MRGDQGCKCVHHQMGCLREPAEKEASERGLEGGEGVSHVDCLEGQCRQRNSERKVSEVGPAWDSMFFQGPVQLVQKE